MAKTASSIDYAADPTDPRLDFTFRPADPSSAQTLSSVDVQRFNREGFLGPLPVFNGPEAEDLRTYVDNLIDTVVTATDRRNSYSVNAYHLVCARLYDVILTPRILDYVQDIIGPNFIAWGSQVFCKLPHDPKEIPLHQDATYWPFTPTKSVTVWLAIDDVDVDNAAMQFVPSSHLLGALPHREFALDGTRVLKRGVDDAETYGERHVDAMPAGNISLHNDLLLHGSPANRSDRRRTGLTIRYTSADVEVLPGYEIWASAAVHCRGTIPPHWPHLDRPEGEHPEKMARFTGGFDGNPPDAG